ncbi:unnamed protein product [Porites lobata]|uniref:EGF-like domain-containing protein n=1 Tax=Porites lobata TaxID=104759 RepID=A0ABN8P476_9CNID|nr:unnamed protein product [Porites lobata]
MGSYACACKAGYSGDGRTCTGEPAPAVLMTVTVHLLLVPTQWDPLVVHVIILPAEMAELAIYLQTLLKKLSNAYRLLFIFSSVPECQNYGSFNDGTRRTSYNSYYYYCDSGLGPGWFRFQGSSGTRMATSCTSYLRCGTHCSGWLYGGHPSVTDGQATRTVYFN